MCNLNVNRFLKYKVIISTHMLHTVLISANKSYQSLSPGSCNIAVEIVSTNSEAWNM